MLNEFDAQLKKIENLVSPQAGRRKSAGNKPNLVLLKGDHR